jgi:hypothetical protein
MSEIEAGYSYDQILEEAGIQITGTKKEFAKQFIASGYNATEAARKVKMRATDKKAAGNRLKNDPDVVRAVEAIRKYTSNLAALTQLEIIEKLREVYKMAMAEGDFKEANKASELLGQSLGMFGRGSTGEAAGKSAGISKEQTTEGRLREILGQIKEQAKAKTS